MGWGVNSMLQTIYLVGPQPYLKSLKVFIFKCNCMYLPTYVGK